MRLIFFIFGFLFFETVTAQSAFFTAGKYRIPGDDNKELLRAKVKLLIEEKIEDGQAKTDSFLFDPNGNLIKMVQVINQKTKIILTNEFSENQLLQISSLHYVDSYTVTDSMLKENKNLVTYAIIINGKFKNELRRTKLFTDSGLQLEEKTFYEDKIFDKTSISYNKDNAIKTIHYFAEGMADVVKENFFYTKKILDSFTVKENEIISKKYTYQFDQWGNIIAHTATNFDPKGKIKTHKKFQFNHVLDEKGNWKLREQWENGIIIATRKRAITYYN
jgi:antitoxin component YwqK of YwqJK toxin-antitoxin module